MINLSSIGSAVYEKFYNNETNRVQLGIVRKMHLKFWLNPLNSSGVVAIINFQFNPLSCLAADPWKLDK